MEFAPLAVYILGRGMSYRGLGHVLTNRNMLTFLFRGDEYGNSTKYEETTKPMAGESVVRGTIAR